MDIDTLIQFPSRFKIRAKFRIRVDWNDLLGIQVEHFPHAYVYIYIGMYIGHKSSEVTTNKQISHNSFFNLFFAWLELFLLIINCFDLLIWSRTFRCQSYIPVSYYNTK